MVYLLQLSYSRQMITLNALANSCGFVSKHTSEDGILGRLAQTVLLNKVWFNLILRLNVIVVLLIRFGDEKR